MRCLVFCAVILIALNAHSTEPESKTESQQFSPPFHVVEIAEAVRGKQEALGVEKFHAWIDVQYGRRIDWINACAWLKAQTEYVMKYYVPPQNGVDEYQYFCGISGTYSEASVEFLSEMDALVGELTRQFGGAIVRWVFAFRDVPE